MLFARQPQAPLVRRSVALVLAVALLLTACGGAVDQSNDELLVVATTTILGDVVSTIVGDDGNVVVLMPIGADPHDFQASAAQVATINQADLVITNGLGLEEGLEDVLDAAVGDGIRVMEIAPLLDPLPFDGEDHDEDDHDDHGSLDPHVWLDPLRMRTAASLIAAELDAIDPGADWEVRANAYRQALTTLDEDINRALQVISDADRRLVTNHGSLGYFADRYGFEVIATVVPAGTTLGDPSSEELATLIEVMLVEGVTVIFAETTQPTQLAQAVAAELDQTVEVVTLYTGSLGEAGSDAATYLEMLQANADRIAAALGG